MPDDSIHTTLARADLLTDTHRHGEALDLLGPALAQHPDDARLHCMAAVCHLGLPKGGRAALDHAREATRLDPSSEQAYRLQALAHLSLDQRGEAVMVAGRAVQLGPGVWQTHYVLGHAALGDRYSNHLAVSAAREAVRLAPHEPSTHLLMARTHLDNGSRATKEDREAAERHIREALRLDPQSSEAVKELARVQLHGRRPTEAMVGFLGALRMDPLNRSAALHLSQAVVAWVWRAHLFLWLVGLLVIRPSTRSAVADGDTGVRVGALVVSLAAVGVCVWVLRRIVRAAAGRTRTVLRATWRGDPLGAVWAALLAPVAASYVVASVVPAALAEKVLLGATVALLAGVVLSWLRLWPLRNR